MLKYLILFILLFWILRRLMNVFVLVKEDQKETGVNDTPKGPYRTNSSQEGEYVDYEEVE